MGNFTQLRKEQLPNRAGWADVSCLNQYPVMCRLASESPPLLLELYSCCCVCRRGRDAPAWLSMPVYHVETMLYSQLAGDKAMPVMPQMPAQSNHTPEYHVKASFPHRTAAPGPQKRLETDRFHYLLNTRRMNFSAAEAYCQTQGGHLASYASIDEQVRSEHVTVCTCHAYTYASTKIACAVYASTLLLL